MPPLVSPPPNLQLQPGLLCLERGIVKAILVVAGERNKLLLLGRGVFVLIGHGLHFSHAGPFAAM